MLDKRKDLIFIIFHEIDKYTKEELVEKILAYGDEQYKIGYEHGKEDKE